MTRLEGWSPVRSTLGHAEGDERGKSLRLPGPVGVLGAPSATPLRPLPLHPELVLTDPFPKSLEVKTRLDCNKCSVPVFTHSPRLGPSLHCRDHPGEGPYETERGTRLRADWTTTYPRRTHREATRPDRDPTLIRDPPT